MTSRSARLLSQGLGALRINIDRGTYRRRGSHRLINWGACNSPYEFLPCDFNPPSAVAIAADKIAAFQRLNCAGVPVPEWTRNQAVANVWLREGNIVFARDTATGHSGQGITVYTDGEIIDTHLFYTKKVPNWREYRIHIAQDQILDVTQKRRKNGHHEANDNYIRNHSNGWVFCRNAVDCPPDGLVEAATKSVHELGLHFGAVDVCVSKSGKVTVFEVNTAPGIEGTTLQKYINFFKEQNV